MPTEDAAAGHYAREGLAEAVFAALAAAGKVRETLTPADLAPVDEFHLGGRTATEAFAASFGAPPGGRLLDIGSGLGGASRYFAEHGAGHVSGVDLTANFVATATALAEAVGLADRVDYRVASALDLPFEARTFDGAWLLHVGMNIAEKARLFAEARRVLKPGARFGIYDVMRTGPGDIAYPTPWASEAAHSFVETPAAYRAGLEAAGFEVEAETSRRDLVLQVLDRMAARAAASGGPPPLGLQIVMGPTAGRKMANLRAALDAGIAAPVEIIARAA